MTKGTDVREECIREFCGVREEAIRERDCDNEEREEASDEEEEEDLFSL